jgi:hypothetical protein
MTRRSQSLRQADVVLGANGVTFKESLVPGWHLNVGGHGWRCGMVGVGQLRPRDRESHGKSSSAHDEQDIWRCLILQCIAVLHTILLSRLVRGLWGWQPGLSALRMIIVQYSHPYGEVILPKRGLFTEFLGFKAGTFYPELGEAGNDPPPTS